MKQLLILFRPFVDLCLLRLNPQDLPASDVLLAVALVAYTVSGVLVSTISLPTGVACLAGITDTALLSGLTVSVLFFQHLQRRLRQTLTALAGTGAVLGVAALPVTSWLHAAQESGQDASMPLLILLLLVGWSVTVAGHILRHALSTVYVSGLVLAIVFYWVSYSVLSSLFPAAA